MLLQESLAKWIPTLIQILPTKFYFFSRQKSKLNLVIK
jgi:hypothetical protein